MQDKGVILLFDAADRGIEQKLDAVCGGVFCSCDSYIKGVNDARMRAIERLDGIGRCLGFELMDPFGTDDFQSVHAIRLTVFE